MRFGRPSPALAVSLLALFVSLSGVGYAATGGTFILGQDNTATTPTRLTATSSGKALQLTQSNTALSASALGLNVRPGQAPLTTNSTVKVANLNADQLDGLDSGSFVQGAGGRTMYIRRSLTVGQTAVAFTVPGFFQVEIECNLASGQPPPMATYRFTNLSADYPIDFMSSDDPDFLTSIAPGSFRGFGTSGGYFATYQVGQSYSLVPGGAAVRTRIATLWLTQRGGSPCSFQGQALLQG